MGPVTHHTFIQSVRIDYLFNITRLKWGIAWPHPAVDWSPIKPNAADCMNSFLKTLHLANPVWSAFKTMIAKHWEKCLRSSNDELAIAAAAIAVGGNQADTAEDGK